MSEGPEKLESLDPESSGNEKVRNWPGRKGGNARPSTGARWNEHCVCAASSKIRCATRNARQPGQAPLAGLGTTSRAGTEGCCDARRQRQVTTPIPIANCISSAATIRARSSSAVTGACTLVPGASAMHSKDAQPATTCSLACAAGDLIQVNCCLDDRPSWLGDSSVSSGGCGASRISSVRYRTADAKPRRLKCASWRRALHVPDRKNEQTLALRSRASLDLQTFPVQSLCDRSRVQRALPHRLEYFPQVSV